MKFQFGFKIENTGIKYYALIGFEILFNHFIF